MILINIYLGFRQQIRIKINFLTNQNLFKTYRYRKDNII